MRTFTFPRLFAEVLSTPSYGPMQVKAISSMQDTHNGQKRPAHIPDIVVTLYSEAYKLIVTTDVRNVRIIHNTALMEAATELFLSTVEQIASNLITIELLARSKLLREEHMRDLHKDLVEICGNNTAASTVHVTERVKAEADIANTLPMPDGPYMEVFPAKPSAVN